jgi:hypothetical protein
MSTYIGENGERTGRKAFDGRNGKPMVVRQSFSELAYLYETARWRSMWPHHARAAKAPAGWVECGGLHTPIVPVMFGRTLVGDTGWRPNCSDFGEAELRA